MSKKRKTRKDKERTEYRNVQSSSEQSPSYSFTFAPSIKPSISKTNSQTYSSHDYTYVIQDIKHTALISSLIIAVSLILFTLMSLNVIELTMFGY